MAKPQLAHRSAVVSTPLVLTKPISFFPAKYSTQELEYLLDHMEEPPTVAIQGEMPVGVNPDAIRQALVPMFELEQLRAHRGLAWAGFDKVKDVIVRYLEWQKLCQDIKAQGGPRHPSMYSWDSQGTMTKATPGTDSSEIVRTEILDDGTRRPLFIEDLRRAVQHAKGPHLPWVRRDLNVADSDAIEHDDVKGLLTCTICAHVVPYQVAKGRQAVNMARGQMARHLKSTRKEPTRHRALYRREFK